MASDEELLYDWRTGNDRSGEELFERYFAPLERFFRNKVNRDHSDLIQATFEACVRGRDRIMEGRSFRSYLFSIAHNVLNRHLRKQYNCREDELASRSMHDLAPGPSSLLLESEKLQLLARALRMLSVEFQEVLELSYWEGMSSTEIGHALSMNPSTVRSHLRRGREQLAEFIDTLSSASDEAHTTEDIDHWAEALSQQLRSHALDDRDDPP